MSEEQVGAELDWKEIVAHLVQPAQSEARSSKQDRSRARRAEIMSAAERVFGREGIARARIADIAAEAGVPLSSLYDYFETKEDIAYAVPQMRMQEFFVEFEAKAMPLAGARDRLELFLWLSVDFARRHQDWARTLYLEVWPSVLIVGTPLRRIMDDYARLILALIHEGSRNGEWQKDPQPYETVNIFIGSTNQLIITWLLYRTPSDLMKAARPLIHRLLFLLDGADKAQVRPKSTQNGAGRQRALKAQKPI